MFIGQSTLPQNFVSQVNAGMRLPQPTAQFFFAMMALGAVQRTAAIENGVGTAEEFGKLMAQGGGMDVPTDLSRFLRSADAYPDAVMFVAGFGKDAGDTVKMRRPVYSGGGYTEEDRRVRPGKPTSLTGQSLQMEEVPVVLSQFEGPWSTAAGGVEPYQIAEFDAKYRKNKDNLASLTKEALLYDYLAFLDGAVRNRFRGTANITYADSMANVLSFTLGAGHSASLDMFLRAKKAISLRERPGFKSNGRYMCLVPPVANVDMASDPSYRDLAGQHREDKNLLFTPLASVQDIDFFECSTLKTYAAGDTVPNDGNAVPAGSTVYEALLFGPNAVGFGQAAPPTLYDTSDTDFGKNAKVIWRSVEAFQTLDSRGIERVLFQDA